ncbi:MAG: M28 family peptidase [Sphingomonas sp.]|nr:M28 family peptidase [Sphingomonas sp.]RZV49265.1 MAG: M28 family peptidase [Sphingomonadaceae bacterium]
MRSMFLAASLLTAPAIAADHHGDGHMQHNEHAMHAERDAALLALSEDVSEERLRADIDTLVGFGTRHTLSSQTDPERGIGAAVRWAEATFAEMGLEASQVCDVVTGDRIPQPTRVCSAIGIQRGTERPNDVIIMTAHIDSRVSDAMNYTDDAPGANDDGSGTVAVIETARLLSPKAFDATIVYATLAGEEQGLFGAKILAAYAKAQGWNVIANLNNDVIGNSCGSDGHCDADHVRVFSEGPRTDGYGDELAAQQRRRGGENDAPSRNLGRYIDTLADRLPQIGLDVRPIWRTDRWGRGGDHIEFLNAGYPAIRFAVAVEDYDHQHQDLRVENGVTYGDTADEMDFAYLAKVTRLNIAALAELASAPPPPTDVRAAGAVQTSTTLRWQPVTGADHYRIAWRRTDASNWEGDHRRAGPDACTAEGCEYVLEGIRVDDWIFGVASVSDGGHHSPVVSAVPGGDWAPLARD